MSRKSKKRSKFPVIQQHNQLNEEQDSTALSRPLNSPPSFSTLSEPIHPSVYLTINNFDYYDWASVKRLKIKECDSEISSEVLDTCEDNITSIDFIGLNSYMNIKLLLHRCPNLRRLTLSNVSLNHYHTDFKRFFLIEVPELTDIKFIGTGKLTKSETHIIDFFFRRVRFGSLNSITFDSINGSKKGGSINSMASDSKSQKNKSTLRNNFTKVSANANSLVNFLLANRQTLTNLVMRRTGIPLFNEKFSNLFDNSNEPEPEHMKLQLESFECQFDTVGFDRVLNAQNRLTVLHCYNKKSFPPSCLDAVNNAIRRCSPTLRDVRFCHNIQSSNSNNSNNNFNNNNNNNNSNGAENKEMNPNTNANGKPSTSSSSEYTNEHDCSVYKYCQQLQHLHITCAMSGLYDHRNAAIFPTNVNNMEQQQQRGSKNQPGTILNLRFLPLSLTHLIIKFDSVSQHGIDLFVHRLPRMINLKFFVCTGNKSMPYRLKLGWIKALVELPEIHIFELNGFQYEDFSGVIDYQHSRPELAKYLEIGENKCLYWKNSQQEKKHAWNMELRLE